MLPMRPIANKRRGSTDRRFSAHSFALHQPVFDVTRDAVIEATVGSDRRLVPGADQFNAPLATRMLLAR
jgi:hypothetical protein